MSNSKQWLEDLRRKRKEIQGKEDKEIEYQREVLGRQGLATPTREFAGDFQ